MSDEIRHVILAERLVGGGAGGTGELDPQRAIALALLACHDALDRIATRLEKGAITVVTRP